MTPSRSIPQMIPTDNVNSRGTDFQTCNRCRKLLPKEDFPLKGSLIRTKRCIRCTTRVQAQEASNKAMQLGSCNKENVDPVMNSVIQPIQYIREKPYTTISLQEMVSLLKGNQNENLELEAFISLPSDMTITADNTHNCAKALRDLIYETTQYHFNSEKIINSRDPAAKGTMTHSFLCAQLEGAETTRTQHPDSRRRRARMVMERFKCGGQLHITTNPCMPNIVRIRLEHHLPHIPYIKISLTDLMREYIQENMSLPATMLYTHIVEKWPENNITQNQVYSYWLNLNKDKWHLDPDQVKSAIQVLKNSDGNAIEMIPTRVEEGISIFAFGLRDIVISLGEEITEIAMDSTWKTNAASFELYAIVAEANGRSLPMAFAFVLTGGATSGAKDRALQDVLQWTKTKCPNIKFTLSDKDTSEINACRTIFNNAKHQICYWHSIRYLEQRLGEDKPPAAYDARIANKIHTFIDPTWCPGITNGHVIEGAIDLTEENLPNDEKPPPIIQTCRAPVIIIKLNSERIPVWPAPQKVTSKDLPPFCPKEFRQVIIEKFRIHLHQHPEIPINDSAGTHLTQEAIYIGAVKDMYQYCYANDLSQPWAYLWNRWYCPAQWQLWARSANPAIPRLKTTMVVESLWKHLKHRELAQFNRPRLDLVTHIVVESLLPRIKQTLGDIIDQRRTGRPKSLASWQKDFKADWVYHAKCDEQRLIEKELEWRKKPLHTKGRAERISQLEVEAKREAGTYTTDLQRWTCSCPAYLISRFLMCKHLVREANTRLRESPIMDLRFFYNIRREHFPPYYHLPGIHTDTNPMSVHVHSVHGLSQKDLPAHDTNDAVVCKDTLYIVGEAGGPREPEDVVDTNLYERSSSPAFAELVAEDYLDDISDEEPEGLVILSEAYKQDLKRKIDALYEEMDKPLHPRFARILKQTFRRVDKVGGDVGTYRARKNRQRTWKGHNEITMYLT